MRLQVWWLILLGLQSRVSQTWQSPLDKPQFQPTPMVWHQNAQETFSTSLPANSQETAINHTPVQDSSAAHSVLPSQLPLTLASRDLNDTWTPPLSTRGRYIVDANGNRFRLVGGNWHGASGTYTGKGNINDPSSHHAGEQAFQTPLCLDRVPVDELVQSFLDLGITTIRLPFSNEMIHTTSTVPDSALRANPQFRGMTPLQIFDACIVALTRRGLAVILNNHTVKSIWCCGVDVNARWNGIQTNDQWMDDWVFLMKRYRDNTRVVGAELYNEVRRDFLSDPTWGSGSAMTDWWNASQACATRIAREANPDALIIIEGINFVGIPTKFTAHSRPELQPVGQISHALPTLDKLVYSSHFYAYTGPNATGSTGSDDPLYRDLSVQQLNETLRQLAFFVSTDTPARHYTAPVWISEFGSAGRTDFLNADRQWWSNFTNFLTQYDAEFAIWPLVGWMENGQGDGWAMHMFDSNGQRLSILDPGDWRLPGLQSAVNVTNDARSKQGKVEQPEATFVQLYTSQGSIQQSDRLYKDNDHLSQPGDVKASCPDGLRLHGVSFDEQPAGLCTDATFERNLWNASDPRQSYTVITTEVPGARSPDWASGLTKLQCPSNAHIFGYSYSQGRMESIVCAQQSRDPTASISTSYNENSTMQQRVGHRTVYFGKQVNVAQDRGQWYAINSTAATCADDELLVGLAFTTSHGDSGRPQALLCQNFHGTTSAVGSASFSAAARILSLSSSFVGRTLFVNAIMTFAIALSV